jgi:hypothetical protein
MQSQTADFGASSMRPRRLVRLGGATTLSATIAGDLAVAIAHNQHADHQFRINRRASSCAIESRKMLTQMAEIENLINLS